MSERMRTSVAAMLTTFIFPGTCPTEKVPQQDVVMTVHRLHLQGRMELFG